MKKGFDFDDINLIPKKCIVNSRSQCNTHMLFGNNDFKLPIVPANMETVINEELCVKLASNGYFYVMHRFDIDIKQFVLDMQEKELFASISVGVNEPTYELLKDFLKNGIEPDYITVDIAHGHSIKMEKMLTFISANFTNSFIIAGNVSTPEATIDLDKWGADAIKVGIGPGSACTTFPVTGFGSRNIQASVIEACSNATAKPIVADGGIKLPSDIAKSIALGADMVMIGGMLAAFTDSPGTIIEHNKVLYKEFYGSASEQNGLKRDRIEGKHKLIELKDISILEHLIYLEQCLQSSISYGGGTKVTDLKYVDYV